MLIESIISGKRNLFWVIFHVLLGLITTITPFAFIFWFYLILVTNFNKAINQLRKGKPLIYIALISYLISFEILGRMSEASPFIPSELCKYLLTLASIIGVMFSIKKGNNLWLILGILLTISVLFDYWGNGIFLIL